MEIRTLRYFLAVAREENMTRAAEQLHVTQPTLSKALKAVEDDIASVLFRSFSSFLSTDEKNDKKGTALQHVRFSRTAFIQVTASNNLAQLNQDLRQLEKHGFRYVFLDEVTLMEDFITQPGMRYSQVEALISRLILDDAFRAYDLQERNRATERILTEVKGRMMEDIVLLETQTARKDAQVFHLQFAVGEFDMVVFQPQTASCEIYEIKHSTGIAPEQTRYLRDEKKCADTASRFGTITGKHVIYRGETRDADGIHYVNVEEYLRAL